MQLLQYLSLLGSAGVMQTTCELLMCLLDSHYSACPCNIRYHNSQQCKNYLKSSLQSAQIKCTRTHTVVNLQEFLFIIAATSHTLYHNISLQKSTIINFVNTVIIKHTTLILTQRVHHRRTVYTQIDISLDSDKGCYPCSDEGSDTAAETSAFI